MCLNSLLLKLEQEFTLQCFWNIGNIVNLSTRVLASLNLPAALEDLSGDTIPPSIVEKARSIVQQGGLQSIEQLIKDLPELMTRNREILDEVR